MGEVVNMPNPEVKQENKLTYAELENIANNLYARLQSVEMSNMFKRLDYLFKVVNYREEFTPEANADGILAASVFHFGEIKIKDLKEYMKEQGVEVRL